MYENVMDVTGNGQLKQLSSGPLTTAYQLHYHVHSFTSNILTVWLNRFFSFDTISGSRSGELGRTIPFWGMLGKIWNGVGKIFHPHRI